MSSVESQIFVNESDLEADFGSNALESFQARNFRQLCDLILSRLDDMMTEPKHSARQHTTARYQPSVNFPGEKDVVQERGANEPAQQMTDDVFGLLEAQEEEQQDEYDRDNDPANDPDEQGEVNESALRIQCAARQQLARDRVKQARIQKKNEVALQRAESATRIQSLARQKHAKKEVARMRLEHRTPTGIPILGRTLPEDMDDEADGAQISDTQHRIVQENISEEGEDEEADAQEQEVLPPPEDHFLASDGRDGDMAASRERKLERPETVMSYASDQFEDDFEDE
uniref:Uncharacterized protein n=1 Tax=Globisporangium ultimum (strain ATCC 200006 / CBS 805.95 / DAOM BR144) TaxID=431595 RepID=K3XAD9_GLOUD